MPLDDSRVRVFAHDDYLTLKEAAREAKTSIPAIYRWAKKGLARAGGRKLPLHWEKTATLVRRSELREFLQAIRDASPYSRPLPPTATERAHRIQSAAARIDAVLMPKSRKNTHSRRKGA